MRASGSISGVPPARSELPPFAALRAFDAVARLGGIRRAAQLLGVDHAVVSRHLRSLELWTSTSLIDRSPAGAVLTAEGARFHTQVAAGIDMLAQATTDLVKRFDDNRLQIWGVPGFVFQWLMARLRDFQARNPQLAIDLRPTDVAPDFARHEADIDIRYAPAYAPPEAAPSCVRSVEIASPAVVPVASAEYLSREAAIREPGDLLRHTLLHEEDYQNWQAWFEAHGLAPAMSDLAGPRLWHAHLTVNAARMGHGIALVNKYLAADEIAAGQLVHIGDRLGFRRISLGSYMFYARADRWTAEPVIRCRRWLESMIATHERREVLCRGVA